MDGHPRNLDPLGRNPVIDQLLARFFARHEIQTHVVASPTLPEAVTRVGHDGHERNLVRQFQLPQHAPDEMLCQRVHADDDVRAPALEQFVDVADAATIEEFARFGAKTVDRPEEILHPVLPVTEHPVVDAHQPRRDRMRLFNRAHDAHGIRVSREELLQARRNRHRRRAMPAARVGRDDQNFGDSCTKHAVML